MQQAHLPQVDSLHAGEPAKLPREGLHVGFTSNAVRAVCQLLLPDSGAHL